MTTNYFQTQTRESGETFISMADDCPDWVADVVRDCHDGELPNDWRYETIAAIFGMIEDGYGPDDASEIADSLTDVYNSALVAWLGDNLNRSSYVDDASAEGLTQGNADVFSQIRTGQYLAIEQMATQILAAVAENAETADS